MLRLNSERVQVDLGPALGAVRVRSVAREHRHTLAHTGLMLWEAAPALARLLLARPALCAGAVTPFLTLLRPSLACLLRV